MAIKILTEDAIDNTNIDGARQNHFSSGMRSGIVKGAFNEGEFFASSENSSNVIALDSCELRISGHQVIIDEPYYHTFNDSDRPSTPTRYSMIAEIVVNDLSKPTFRIFIQPENVSLIKDNLFKNEKGNGTYQLEIGRFTLNTNGNITNVVRTANVITGGADIINVGTVDTTTLLPTEEASVEVTSTKDNEENNYLNFTFNIPQGIKGDKGERGEQGVKGDSGVASGVVLSNTYDNSDENGYTQQAVNNLVSNPNLLINGDFRVNQREQTSYSNVEFCLDRWYKNSSHTITVNSDKTITQTKNDTAAQRYFYQVIENFKPYLGKTLTISMKVRDGVAGRKYKIGIYNYITGNLIATEKTYSGGAEIVTETVNVPTNWEMLAIIAYPQYETLSDISITIEWVKAELGAVATAYNPRPYAEELAMCQRYYIKANIHASTTVAVANGTILYPFIPLPVTLRTKPTLIIKTMPDIRGNGTYGNTPTEIVVTDISPNGVGLMVSINGLTNMQIYSLANGVVVFDAEINSSYESM